MSATTKALLFCALVWPQPAWCVDWCGTLFLSPGQVKSNFMIVNGWLRGFGLFVPTTVNDPTPLILNFHGFGSNHLIETESSCWRRLAQRQGAIVVYPQGRSLLPSWNAGDYCCLGGAGEDAEFAHMLVKCLSKNLKHRKDLNIDARQVYAVGLSNGGAMAGRLACEQSDVFSGVAVTSQSFPLRSVEQCRHSGISEGRKPAIPVVESRGTMDVIVPYMFSWGWSLPARESLTRWRDAMGCRSQPIYEDICDRVGSGPDCEYGHTWCESYYDCDNHAVVSQCTLVDGHLLYDNDHDYNPCEDAWFQFQRYDLAKP